MDLRCYKLLVQLSLVVALVVASGMAEARGAEPADSPARQALETIFNPQRAPARKSMGLLQRSFLDLIETAQTQLQVALVLDGTDSMRADLDGVRGAIRSLVADLRRYKGDQVTLGAVVYRDVGAKSGAAALLLTGFTADARVLEDALAHVEPETGAPYFPEAIDLGVHEALEKLPWSEDADATRWLLLFGDAPPYDADFTDQQTQARRWYDTDLLVNLAQRKKVQISCVLCTSRGEEREAYQQVLDKTRRFMNALATGTGGLMLDLSYPDIQAALVESAKKQRVQYQPIGRITRADVEAAKRTAEEGKLAVAAGQRVRLAVLPHMPLESITFDRASEAVQVAAELRLKLRQTPRVEVKSPVDVERELRRLKASAVPASEWLPALANRLRVDYVVWGNYRRAKGVVEVTSAIYTKDAQQALASTEVLTSATLPEVQLAGRVVETLAKSTVRSAADPTLVACFAPLQSDAGLQNAVLTPVSDSPEARSDLLVAMEALEQALAHPAGSSEGRPLLDEAEARLVKCLRQDTKNAFAYLLLANCLYNQARGHVEQGQPDAAQERFQRCVQALERAFRNKDELRSKNMQQEIAADYQLLVKKDAAEAIKLYAQLAQASDDTRLHSALRAHWMLAGIYSGDWGVDPKVVDAAQARAQLIQILAHWPDSSEAAFIKKNLRWNEQQGETQYPQFPQENKLITASLVGPRAQ